MRQNVLLAIGRIGSNLTLILPSSLLICRHLLSIISLDVLPPALLIITLLLKDGYLQVLLKDGYLVQQLILQLFIFVLKLLPGHITILSFVRRFTVVVVVLLDTCL